MLDRRRLLIGAVAALAAPAIARADEWAALRRPGAVAIMRHALAPGTGDPPGFRLGDCATQRNLDARGRAQARAVGEAIRAAGAGFDRVLTSQWCRCRETAELLGFGEPEPFPVLNSFFAGRFGDRADQTRRLRAFLAGRDRAERLMLVTHQVNVTALTGRGVASGEVFAIEVDRDGEAEVLSRVLLRA